MGILGDNIMNEMLKRKDPEKGIFYEEGLLSRVNLIKTG
ncbi:hypothetical protein B4081_3740 [Bacillus cereus]|nr:hypothetical protein B4081_3740 [Bacillus cereus]